MRVVVLWIAVTGIAACQFFDSPVERAVNNCRGIKAAGTAEADARAAAMQSCDLIREACADDRHGAVCESLLRRYR